MDKLIKPLLLLAIILSLANLYGCGHGGGGAPPPAVGKLTISFSTELPSGSTEQIGSVDLTVELPAGVTLPLPAGEIPVGPGGLLDFSGVGATFRAIPTNPTAYMRGTYIPASLTSKGTVKMVVATITADNHGMGPGQFATLFCDFTPGAAINLAGFKATDALIGNVSGVKLYDSIGGILGPAAATYAITILSGDDSGISGSSGTSSFSGYL